MNELERIAREAAHLDERGASYLLATVVRVAGSSYRRPGARLLLLPDGRSIGSISGGCLEDDLRRRAREVLADGAPRLVTYDTSDEDDLVWGTGLGCGGRVHVFIERLGDPLPDWIGALRENIRARQDTDIAVAFGDGLMAKPLDQGAGSYEIRDWTMFFKFDDGTAWSTDFSTLGPEEKPDASLVFRTRVYPKAR